MWPFQGCVKCRATAAEDTFVNNWRATSLGESGVGLNTVALSCKGGNKGWAVCTAVHGGHSAEPLSVALFVPGMKTSRKASFDRDNLSFHAYQWQTW